ncbi:short-chain dehydrogenase [Knoellia sinensis KCTC 19936]|uniref:Short-chain dehydrogenase n=1 Tax=Knoellia sinensis KCTC 19936 TaxID=1385520 RepID=A0A0A0J3R6_9MICO|nr:SDR family NAD(P)-dependent oxidoreductase [Knoellia sinensis]KGN31344.1 short-chain dehydrogenase [Knoellia sinensis KCTC 19936]
MSREPVAGQRIWIVGASSGIGAELAHELVRRGARVAISARRREELEAVAGSGRSDAASIAAAPIAVVPVDVTDRASVDGAAAAVRAELGGLDGVIHSAAYWKQFDATTWDRDDFARHIEVNLLGLNNVLGAVVPEFARSGAGHVVGIASVAGYRGLAGSEAYGATKAAQLNLLEAMRASLSRSGVRVTTVSPGFVRTPMTDTNRFTMPFLIDADEAARSIADGMESGDDDISFPLPMAVAMRVARLVPGRAWTALSSRASRE